MPSVGVEIGASTDALLNEPGLECNSSRSLVSGRVLKLDAMEAKRVGPFGGCNAGPGRHALAPGFGEYPVRDFPIAIFEVGVDGYTAYHDPLRAVHDGPRGAPLFDPPQVQTNYPIGRLRIRIEAAEVPLLDIGCGVRLNCDD